MTTRHVEEIRYDLDSPLAQLDMDSQIGLMDLAMQWAERNAEELDKQIGEECAELRAVFSPASYYADTVKVTPNAPEKQIR